MPSTSDARNKWFWFFVSRGTSSARPCTFICRFATFLEFFVHSRFIFVAASCSSSAVRPAASVPGAEIGCSALRLTPLFGSVGSSASLRLFSSSCCRTTRPRCTAWIFVASCSSSAVTLAADAPEKLLALVVLCLGPLSRGTKRTFAARCAVMLSSTAMLPAPWTHTMRRK